MLNDDFREVLELAAGGPVERDRIRIPRMPDGLKDSLTFLMQSSCESSRRYRLPLNESALQIFSRLKTGRKIVKTFQCK